MKFNVIPFNNLDIQQLYAILRLRSEVFVVEQECAYQDMDNYDQKALHILGFLDGELVAYARIFAPGGYYKEAAIGRILSIKKHRMEGLGKQLMSFTIEECNTRFNKSGIRIMAQCYLNKFYQDFGFKIDSEEFLEDGIPHVEMLMIPLKK